MIKILETLQQYRAQRRAGCCAFCDKPLPRGSLPARWRCGRRPCRRRYQLLYQRERRGASGLVRVVSTTPLDGRQIRELLACGCVVDGPASKARKRKHCPQGHMEGQHVVQG